jgi:hypothetical protein
MMIRRDDRILIPPSQPYPLRKKKGYLQRNKAIIHVKKQKNDKSVPTFHKKNKTQLNITHLNNKHYERPLSCLKNDLVF